MKNMLLTVLILIGITFYYDVEAQGGFAWVNNSTENCTILSYPKLNLVIWYSSDGKVYKETFTEFARTAGENILENAKTAPILILPRPKSLNAPRIKY